MPSTLFRNGLIFDGHHSNLIADKYVLIKEDRIAAITDVVPDGIIDRDIDLTGMVIMPGLIDCHFHAYACSLDIAELESLPMTYIAQRGRHLVENALKRGFTTLRDAGGADYGLWRSIEEGYVQGSRLFYSGKVISQTGGHGDMRPQHEEPCHCNRMRSQSWIVDGVDAVRKAVRENLRQGAHQIKLMVSGGVISPADPIWMLQFSEDEITAAVDEATRRRSYVMAHAYTAESISRSVKLGVRSIEHANLIDQQAAEVTAQYDAYVVPTLVAYDALNKFGKETGAPRFMLDKLAEVYGKGLEAVELCRAAGVKLGLGTDLLGNMHVHQMDELRIRSEVDSPFDVLHSATAINAEIVQKSGELGCIREGAYADMLIIDGNPLEDLSLIYDAQKGIKSIMRGGREIRK